jgi:hypothetical protein
MPLSTSPTFLIIPSISSSSSTTSTSTPIQKSTLTSSTLFYLYTHTSTLRIPSILSFLLSITLHTLAVYPALLLCSYRITQTIDWLRLLSYTLLEILILHSILYIILSTMILSTHRYLLTRISSALLYIMLISLITLNSAVHTQYMDTFGVALDDLIVGYGVNQLVHGTSQVIDVNFNVQTHVFSGRYFLYTFIMTAIAYTTVQFMIYRYLRKNTPVYSTLPTTATATAISSDTLVSMDDTLDNTLDTLSTISSTSQSSQPSPHPGHERSSSYSSAMYTTLSSSPTLSSTPIPICPLSTSTSNTTIASPTTAIPNPIQGKCSRFISSIHDHIFLIIITSLSVFSLLWLSRVAPYVTCSTGSLPAAANNLRAFICIKFNTYETLEQHEHTVASFNGNDRGGGSSISTSTHHHAMIPDMNTNVSNVQCMISNEANGISKDDKEDTNNWRKDQLAYEKDDDDKQQPNIIVVIMDSASSSVIYSQDGRRSMPYYNTHIPTRQLFEYPYTISSAGVTDIGMATLMTGVSTHHQWSDTPLNPTIAHYAKYNGYHTSMYSSFATSSIPLDTFFEHDSMDYIWSVDHPDGWSSPNKPSSQWAVTVDSISNYSKPEIRLRNHHGVIDDEVVVERFIHDLHIVEEHNKQHPDHAFKPFFSMLGLYSLHYAPIYDDEYDNMYENVDDYNYIGRYLNAAHKFDRALEKLFTGLQNNNVLDNTAIIIIGDHGEAVYKRPRAKHLRASLVFPEITRPMMSMYLPASIVGTAEDNDDDDQDTVQYSARKQEHLAHSTADLLPTLLDLMGQEPCHCLADDSQEHMHRDVQESLSRTCYMSGRSIFRSAVTERSEEQEADEVTMSIARSIESTSSDASSSSSSSASSSQQQHANECILPVSLRNEIIRRQITDESICPYVEKHFVFAAHKVMDDDEVKIYRNPYRFIASASYSRLRPYHTHSHSLLLADLSGEGSNTGCHLFWDDYYPSIQMYPLSLGYNFTDHVKHGSILPQAITERKSHKHGHKLYVKPLVLSGPSDVWTHLSSFHQHQWLAVASCFEDSQRKACPVC